MVEFREYGVIIPANINGRIITHPINPLDPALQGIGIIQSLNLSVSDLRSCQRAVQVVAVEGILLPDQFIATGIDIGEPVLGIKGGAWRSILKKLNLWKMGYL